MSRKPDRLWMPRELNPRLRELKWELTSKTSWETPNPKPKTPSRKPESASSAKSADSPFRILAVACRFPGRTRSLDGTPLTATISAMVAKDLTALTGTR
jgi:hypothetical protein